MKTSRPKKRRLWVLVVVGSSLAVLLLWLGVGRYSLAMNDPLYASLETAYRVREADPNARERGTVDLTDIVETQLPKGTTLQAARMILENAGFELFENKTSEIDEELSGSMHSKRLLSFVVFAVVLQFNNGKLVSNRSRAAVRAL